MEDNDSCLPGRCAEQCATTVLQKRSRHPSTCWGKVALLASWGVMTLCLLWWNFCSRLEKNVLCRAGMIVIHDFHICLLMWKLRAPGFARTTCFSAKKWNHGFQRERSWCNSCLSCPEETKGFLSERVARKTAYCRRTPKGASRGWSFLSWKKKQCESARCAIRPRKLESDEIRYFHACSPSKFVALVVQDGWDDIGCQLHRYFCFSHKRLARWFHHCDLGITVFLAGWVGKDIFWGTFLKLCPRSEGLAHFARKQLVSWVLFLGSLRIHLSDVILSGSADGISSMEGYLSIHPLHLAKKLELHHFRNSLGILSIMRSFSRLLMLLWRKMPGRPQGFCWFGTCSQTLERHFLCSQAKQTSGNATYLHFGVGMVQVLKAGRSFLSEFAWNCLSWKTGTRTALTGTLIFVLVTLVWLRLTSHSAEGMLHFGFGFLVLTRSISVLKVGFLF